MPGVVLNNLYILILLVFILVRSGHHIFLPSPGYNIQLQYGAIAGLG